MRFTGHLLMNTPLLILFPLFGSKIIIIMIASVLIDLDHLYLLIKRKAYSWNEIHHLMKNINSLYQKYPGHAFKNIIYIFHTIEFNIILLAFAFAYPVLIYIWMGFMFHIITDIIHHKSHKMPILRWLSFITFLVDNNSNN